jgi:UDP-2,3-diacylglucosamine pyrophosphatase LpxH
VKVSTPKEKYQSVFISDVHLGTKGCKAKLLYEFLDTFDAENLFLVGDIIDGWALRRRHYWTKKHNHDEFIRPFFRYDFQFGRCQILDSFDYVGISGKHYYITHGDHFDLTMKIPTPLINFCAHIWDYIPHKEENSSFSHIMYDWLGTERIIHKYIKAKGYDCAITGHTHSPKIKEHYMNCGDWVTNCTALVEHLDGTWELLRHGN